MVSIYIKGVRRIVIAVKTTIKYIINNGIYNL